MSDITTRLRSDIAAQSLVIASVSTLLTGLAQRIREANANDDTDELDEIADDLEQNTTLLSQAVVENTSAQDSAGTGTAGEPTPPQPTQEPASSPSVDSSEVSGQEAGGEEVPSADSPNADDQA